MSAADAYPYLQSGQLTGLLAGMKGGAEYEVLVQKAGYSKAYMPAVAAMDSQSLAHVVIMLLVIIGNIAYFVTQKEGGVMHISTDYPDLDRRNPDPRHLLLPLEGQPVLQVLRAPVRRRLGRLLGIA